ncbi:MAG: AAA family ATPase [Bacteroidales bacterium]|nr:AAA family ATPase [Bacteroidales bacterium]
MMKKNNLIQILSFLAVQMEDSETQLINAIAPGTLPEYERPRRRSERRESFVSDEPRYKSEMVDQVVLKNKQLADFLAVTPLQAAIFVAGFAQNVDRKDFDKDNICSFFGIKSMEFLMMRNDFEELVRKRIFLAETTHQFSERNDYIINPQVKEAIFDDKKLDLKTLKAPDFDRYKFVNAVSNLIESRENEKVSSLRLFRQIGPLEKQHKNLTFVKNFLKLNFDVEVRTLFYEVCDDFVTTRARESDIECTLKDIYAETCLRMDVARELKEGEHKLQKAGLIEVTQGSMFSDASIVLTDKGKQLFLEEDYDLFSTDGRSQSLIYPDKIAEKSMFYDKEQSEQLELLKENLLEEKFSELQNQLEKLAMPKGVAALFYGLPGTGKTETAMQIARITGRAVCHVDISAAKSCWYGESQKLVKGIFTNYRRLCEKEKQKPILLFNEADALLSSRQNIHNVSGSSSVAQTENAIQNIILEEMEKLDGILIATTNLTDNLDSAFARRFLFKVEFGQPTVEAKQSIWKSKLEWLVDEDCRALATKFDFSGGEIDNIVRKVVMEEVLHGTRPTLAEIEELCRHEKIGNGCNGGSIGFQA